MKINRHMKSKQMVFLLRWAFFTVGVMILALGIVLMIRADLGTAPWDVLHIGLHLQFGLTIGMWSIIVGILIIGLSSFLVKSWPQIGAVFNMILVGVFIDIYMLIPWLSTPSSFIGQLIMFGIGLVIMGYGMGLYIAPRCGVGPRDSLMLALMQITGWKVQWIRGGMEVFVLIVGWLLGGPVFIGTIIFGVTIGSIAGFALPQTQNLVDKVIGGIQIEDINKRAVRVNHHDGVSQ